MTDQSIRHRFAAALVKTGCLLLILHFPAFAKGRIIIDSLSIREHHLCLSFHLQDFFDEKVIRDLESGLVSEVRHHVQLWQRRGLYSSIEKDTAVVLRLYYDNWTKKYALSSKMENRLTGRPEALIEKSSNIAGLMLANLNTTGKYYLTIQSTFQPISDDTYAELHDWVSGQEDDVGPPARRGRFFAFLADVLGFGDRQCDFKTQEFVFTPQLELRYLK
jgi:hypothetical protein